MKNNGEQQMKHFRLTYKYKSRSRRWLSYDKIVETDDIEAYMDKKFRHNRKYNFLFCTAVELKETEPEHRATYPYRTFGGCRHHTMLDEGGFDVWSDVKTLTEYVDRNGKSWVTGFSKEEVA